MKTRYKILLCVVGVLICVLLFCFVWFGVGKTINAIWNFILFVIALAWFGWVCDSIWNFGRKFWLSTIERNISGINGGCDTVLFLMLCIIAFFFPPFGWLFGKNGVSVGKKEGSNKCRHQGIALVLAATFPLIIVAYSFGVFALLKYLGYVGLVANV